jgi:phosphate transport system substrate-binding protein
VFRRLDDIIWRRIVCQIERHPRVETRRDGLDSLALDADTTARIFNGDIERWDDEAIRNLNPNADLPNDDIIVFFRSDESGTTDNFTKYLHSAAPDSWTAKHSKAWTGTGEGRAKSAGVQQAALQNENSISYMEWSYARDAALGTAEIDNGSSAPVTLSSESAGKALESAKIVGSGNDLTLELDYRTAANGTYPIVLVTYEIVCSGGQPASLSTLLKSFLDYAAGDGQQTLEELGYAPLPESIRTRVSKAIGEIA